MKIPTDTQLKLSRINGVEIELNMGATYQIKDFVKTYTKEGGVRIRYKFGDLVDGEFSIDGLAITCRRAGDDAKKSGSFQELKITLSNDLNEITHMTYEYVFMYPDYGTYRMNKHEFLEIHDLPFTKIIKDGSHYDGTIYYGFNRFDRKSPLKYISKFISDKKDYEQGKIETFEKVIKLQDVEDNEGKRWGEIQVIFHPDISLIR